VTETEVSKYRKYTDDNLVVEGGVSASTEMMRRLKEAMVRSEASATILGERISRLNVWLLWFTIAIFALTAVLTAVGIGILRPLR
jgi:hypothetical protein